MHPDVRYLVVQLGDAVDGQVFGPGHESLKPPRAGIAPFVPLVDDLHTP